MTKSSLGTGSAHEQLSGDVGHRRGGAACDLYAPGHQIHYKHQGQAVRSPSRTVRNLQLDDTEIYLTLDGGSTLHWRHHDPERLTRLAELLPGKCVIYPEYHAMRIGPYWFNCATEEDHWQDCELTGSSHTAR